MPVDPTQIRCRGRADSERAGDHVSARVVLRLCLRDPSRCHDLGGHVVIRGESAEPAVAKEVRPAVPDVGDHPRRTDTDGEDDRCAHAGEPRIDRACSPHGGVGLSDRGTYSFLEGLVAGEGTQRGHERPDRNPACDLTTRKSSEAVRDHVDLALGVGENRVLVRSPATVPGPSAKRPRASAPSWGS